MTDQPLRLGFLASRNGSSMRAILAAIAEGDLAAQGVLAVSNNRQAPALEAARAAGLKSLCIPTRDDPEAADAQLADALTDAGVDLVILSGYLRRLGPKVLAAFPGRILNIHPGPLPRFGGEGMYGARVHEAVIAAGVAESGAVIHVVDGDYDHGPAVARLSVPVAPDDTPETLGQRVTALEPDFYLETLKAIVAGKIALPTAP
ncbi:formyltransferase family protein [Phenylobacterium sp.]|uniref:formyltransferase family protein n=1 Tax=Phenylobacterium sp. TaxID=1871053 RepID=UPI00300375A3